VFSKLVINPNSEIIIFVKYGINRKKSELVVAILFYAHKCSVL
jgi:hypothetical protein